MASIEKNGQMEDNVRSAKRMKPNFELPSRDEQKQLHQMETLMRSNLLTLQTNELLNEISAESKFSSKKLTEWLTTLEEDLRSSEKYSCANRELTGTWLTQQKYGLELSGFDSDIVPTLVFQPPSEVSVIGSFSVATATAPLFNIDIAITIPNNCLASRDIVNHIYLDKRALFLGGVRKSLEQINKKCEIRYKNFETVLFKGDKRKPFLQLQPNFSESVVIRLIPVVSADVFKTSQLRPQKNNVRPPEWMTRLKSLKADGKGSEELDKKFKALPPTPDYNNAVLEDLAVLLHHQIISRAVKPFDNVCRALMLFKIWLTQREMRFAIDGLDSHCAALLFAFLVQTKRISMQAAPLLIFQSLMAFLSETDLTRSVLNLENATLIQLESSADSYVQLLHPLFGQTFNAFWRISVSSALALRREAIQSLSALQHSQTGTFADLFLEKKGFVDTHDIFLKINLSCQWNSILSAVPTHTGKQSSEEAAVAERERNQEVRLAALHSTAIDFSRRQIEQILKLALGDRVSSLSFSLRPPQSQIAADGIVNYSLPIASNADWQLIVGAVFDVEKSIRKVDRGPVDTSKNTTAVKQFRSFWGERTGLRRFKDGAIVDAVVWESDSFNKAGSLFEAISRYALGRHCPWIVGADCEKVFASQSVLNIASLLPHSLSHSLSLSHKAVEALDELRSLLVNKVHNIPVKIDSVMGCDAALRYTSLCEASQHPLLLHIVQKESDVDANQALRSFLRPVMGESISLLAAPICAIAKFESSNKWPLSGDAIEKCKTAMLLKLRVELSKIDILSVIHDGSIDIIFHGFVFRLLPFAGVELEKLIYKRDESSLQAAVAIANREWTVPVLHHNFVRSLHAQHTSFGEAVQLLRLWLAKHYFSGHICHEALELIVAHQYLKGGHSTTGFAAFYHALQTLSGHDWDEEPLIVDFVGQITAHERAIIVTRFRALRSAAESGNALSVDNPAMYLVSSCDQVNDYQSSLSHKSPERVVLGMIVHAARKALSKIVGFFECSNPVFQSPTVMETLRDSVMREIFASDAILRRCNHTAKFHKSLICEDVDSGPQFARLQVYANMPNKELLVSTVVSMKESSSINPAQSQLIDKIQAAFGDLALFFWDETSGRNLGILLKPSFTRESEFNVLKAKFRTEFDEKSSCQANIPELLEQICLAAEGLIIMN